MARLTVEDCVPHVPNRFELILLAAQRARNISGGAQLTVQRDNDKNPVVALREIAEATVSLSDIEDDLIKAISSVPEPDPLDEVVADITPTDQNIFGLHDTSDEDVLPIEEDEDRMSHEQMQSAIEAELSSRSQR